MAVGFPAWWEPEVAARVPKIEDVCIARFDPLLTGAKCVYWLDTDEQTQQVLFEDSEAYLRIVRLGGEVDMENNRDIHRVQFAAIHEDRDISWDIVAFVQRVLYAYERPRYVTMPGGAKVLLGCEGETLGPILDPQQIRDARLVSVTMLLSTPWPKGVDSVIRANLGL